MINLNTSCSCYGPTYRYSTEYCDSIGEACCRETTKNKSKPICKKTSPAPNQSQTLLYSCNNYNCKEDKNGSFKTLSDCEKNCQENYSCDLSTNLCTIDPLGRYSSFSECIDNCNPSLIIPKKNINANSYNEQIAESKFLQNSLNLSELRINQISLKYIFYILLTVIIIGLIFFYIINNTENVTGTIISIFSAFLIVILIVGYFFNLV